MPLTDEQKAKLKELLAEADAEDVEGFVPAEGVVPKSVLKGRMSDKDKAAQKLKDDYEAKLAELQQQHADATAKLGKYENEGKTAEELYAQQLAAQEQQTAAWERKHADAAALAEQRYDALKSKALREMVSEALAGTKVKPAYAPAALREALAENKLAVVDNDGQFSLQVTVDGLPADNPAEAIGQWWQKRTDLHEVKGAPSPSPGAGVPPADPPPKDPLEGKTPGYQQFAAALAAQKPETVPAAGE
jgi:hypothetical protein